MKSRSHVPKVDLSSLLHLSICLLIVEAREKVLLVPINLLLVKTVNMFPRDPLPKAMLRVKEIRFLIPSHQEAKELNPLLVQLMKEVRGKAPLDLF